VLEKTNQVLAKYAGLMESARANNRQGFPIGAAYLRQASNLLRSDALPGLADAVDVEQTRITSAYRDASRADNLLAVIVVGAFAVLLVVQVWLSFRTRRLFNMSLVAATAIVLVGGVIGLGVMSLAQHSANDVRSGSLANTIALATARTDAFDGKSAESLTLINRGSGQPFEEQYLKLTNRASSALSSIAGRQPARAPIAALDTYETAHRLVRTRDDAGDWDGAVRLATTADPRGTKTTFAAFDSISRASLRGQASHVADGLNSARRALGVTAVLLLIAGIVAAGLAWRGIGARLREYR
jgi:protein-S-isoprenylcysteine O-methyltransferase Ste14